MKTKKFIALGLVFVLVFCNAFSVNAVGIIGEMITEISGLNRLTVSAALNNYFNSREAFLLNQADTINVPLAGVVEDEAAHREKYVSEDIVFVDSSISIGDIVSSDTQADAAVTETIAYTKDGVTNTATVAHKLFLVLNDENIPVVVSDRYFEEFSGFRSCSYVDESVAFDLNEVGGSGSCIAHVAWNERGTTEDANGCTKYGQWYGHPDWAWCAIFVSWCANEANIATSIIPNTADPNALKSGTVFYPISDIDNGFTPQAGDIILFTWYGTQIDHVGIVYSATDTHVLIVHGNNSANAVADWKVPLTDATIVGFGRPAYALLTHDCSYRSNSTGHWYACDNCGYEYSTEAHSLVRASDGVQHWYQCEDCAYQEGSANHTFTSAYTTTSSKHWRYCTTCAYRIDYGNHLAKAIYSKNSTQHWNDCTTCGYDMNKEDHTFVQSGSNGDYVCSKCGYTTPVIQLGLRPTDVTALHF